MTVLASSGIEQVEFEPNDTPATASPLDAVGAVNGAVCLGPRSGLFSLHGQERPAAARARADAQPGVRRDLFLRLLDSEGKQLAQASQTADDERSSTSPFLRTETIP